MDKKNILVTTSSFGTESKEPIQVLENENYRVVFNPYARKITEKELMDLSAEYEPVGLLAGTEPITKQVLKAAVPHLKVISRVGVGWDNIDHQAAEALGVFVYRTSGVLDQAVAELTIGLMITALRRLNLKDREIRTGQWKKEMGSLLGVRKIGIIGMGAIGRKVGELAKAFGADIYYYDPVMDHIDWAEKRSLEELITSSEIITIHASGGRQILGEEEIKKTRSGAILINTARGGLIEESALYNALNTGRIGYACLDVFETEPYTGRLVDLDNVMLTPHIGSYAREARIQMENMAVHQLISGLKKR
jgi:D-3-phosphoglycerate dehydrogenase